MVIGTGYTDRFLTADEARDVFAAAFEEIPVRGKRLLFVIPDTTRSGPIDLCFHAITDLLLGVAAKVDFLVALGTHIPLDEARIARHLGITPEERRTRYAEVGIYNHDWKHNLRRLGVVPASEICELCDGLLNLDMPVEINERIFDYDRVIIVGPVFPHEVVGFSGGNKYFFPGISGADVINLTHWMSGLIGSGNLIGMGYTSVRRVIDRAASLIKMDKSCFSLVVKGHHDLAGLYFGSPEESQAAAAELSAQVNIHWVEKPYQTVVSVMPDLYDDIWTAAKGMYKVEPAVQDGGTVIIYAPHIDEVSYTHGELLDRVGYHVRDYFLSQWDQFRDVPGGILAHSTHLKGTGSYENGVERPRINVVLATGIPRERCERINLGYMDPNTLRLEDYQGREDEGVLVIPRAGELLYRVKS